MSYDKAKALLRNSVSRPTLFKIIMPSRFIGGGTNDYLEYFCQSTEIPEVRAEAIAVRGHEKIGITRSQPSLIIWSKPLRIEVIENSDFTVHQDFKQWFDQLNTGTNETQGGRMAYYDQIVGDIELVKLENPDTANGSEHKEVMRVKFIDAYPQAVGAVRLDQNAPNTFTTFAVEFQYESYTCEYS